MATYEGLLALVGDDEEPLGAVVTIEGGRLVVRAQEFAIGDWALGEVTVRLVRHFVRLTVGGDELVFEPLTLLADPTDVVMPGPGGGSGPASQPRRASLRHGDEVEKPEEPRRPRPTEAVDHPRRSGGVAGLVVIITLIVAGALGMRATRAEEAVPGPTVEATGRGNMVADMVVSASEVTILVVDHAGAGRFTVTSYTTDGVHMGTVMAGEGPYRGMRLLSPSGQEVVVLEIRTEGRWQMETRPLSSARSFSATITGTGDEVLIYTGAALAIGAGHAGEGPFLLRAFGPYGSADLIAGADVFNGSAAIPAGTIVLTVQAGGEWTLAPR